MVWRLEHLSGQSTIVRRRRTWESRVMCEYILRLDARARADVSRQTMSILDPYSSRIPGRTVLQTNPIYWEGKDTIYSDCGLTSLSLRSSNLVALSHSVAKLLSYLGPGEGINTRLRTFHKTGISPGGFRFWSSSVRTFRRQDYTYSRGVCFDVCALLGVGL